MALITAGKTNLLPVTAFHANHTTQVNLSNPQSLTPVAFTNVVSETGSSYNSGTSTFTCPITGWYHFTTSYEINGPANNVWYYYGIALNGGIINPHDLVFSGTTYHKMHDDIIKHFTAGDLITVGAANLAGGNLMPNTNQFAGILLGTD